MSNIQDGGPVNVSLPLDITMARILSILVGLPQEDVPTYLEKANWIIRNVPINVLKKELHGIML
jgi:hypothetical protein